jgi:4-hydroxy-tetrahydrodipicolinate synthase
MFEGSGVALVTPFKNGKVDEAALEKLIEEQISSGTKVLIPCGTTGESATLTHEEHDRVISLTVTAAGKRAKVLAGAGSNSTEEAIRLTRHAKQAGADGALHICPYYNKPTQEGLFLHFQAIANAVELPLVLYNIPGRTGVNMLPKTVARLTKFKSIVGIKEASGLLTQASDILEQCPPDFELLSGEDALTFPMLALGGKGAISVTANVLPKKCALLIDSALRGEWETARKIHYELAEMNRVLFIETNPAPVKTALALMKKCSADLRLPLAPLTPASLSELNRVLAQYGLI